MCSDDLKNGLTTRLVIAMKYVLHGAPGDCGVINLAVFDGVHHQLFGHGHARSDAVTA